MSKTLTTKEAEALLVALEERYTNNMHRHKGAQWSVIPKAKEANHTILLIQWKF